VFVSGDTKQEADETFFLSLVGAQGATLSDSQGLGTILNDDSTSSRPSLSISDASVVEGNSGSKLMTFTISLSQATSQSVRVNYRTANGTAKTSDNDYVSKSGTITFSPGQTTKTITVAIQGDKKRESDERFYANLSGASGAEIADSQGEGTIFDDDGSGSRSLRNSHAAAFDAAIEAFLNCRSKKRDR
jgi:hypothetical protein